MPYKDANNEAVVTVVSETSEDLISHKSVDDYKQAWKETAVICPGPKRFDPAKLTETSP